MKSKQKQVRGDTEMLNRIRKYATLRQWRDEYLSASLTDLASRVKMHVSRFSRLESGEVPKNKRCWLPYLKAYQLEQHPNEFARMAGLKREAVTAGGGA